VASGDALQKALNLTDRKFHVVRVIKNKTRSPVAFVMCRSKLVCVLRIFDATLPAGWSKDRYLQMIRVFPPNS